MTTSFTVILWVIAVAGVGAVLVGIRFIVGSRQTLASVPPPVAVPEHPTTTGRGRNRIIDRAVFLALELCRLDGAIGEAEIEAIEVYLPKRFEELPPGEPKRIVSRMLRATMHQYGVEGALAEIIALGDEEHREAVVHMLREVARSDPTLSERKAGFIKHVASKLGVEVPSG